MSSICQRWKRKPSHLMLFASCVDCWLLHPPLLLITNRTCKYVILITWAIIFRETHNKIKPKCVFPWMKLFLWSQCLRTILPGEFVFFSAQKFKDYTVPVYEWFSMWISCLCASVWHLPKWTENMCASYSVLCNWVS